jgi:D-3-phosphoglycerate dehydrogenase
LVAILVDFILYFIKLCVKIFQNRGHTVDFKDTLKEPELIKIIGDYDGMVVRSATKVKKYK